MIAQIPDRREAADDHDHWRVPSGSTERVDCREGSNHGSRAVISTPNEILSFRLRAEECGGLDIPPMTSAYTAPVDAPLRYWNKDSTV